MTGSSYLNQEQKCVVVRYKMLGTYFWIFAIFFLIELHLALKKIKGNTSTHLLKSGTYGICLMSADIWAQFYRYAWHRQRQRAQRCLTQLPECTSVCNNVCAMDEVIYKMTKNEKLGIVAKERKNKSWQCVKPEWMGANC